MKLNLGCGFNLIKDAVNVDKINYPNVYQYDIEKTPWPWNDHVFNDIIAIHSLEHVGKDPDVFIKIIQEMYRVSANGAHWKIEVPHWRHDNFYHDPTHVRVITPVTLMMFSQERNYQDYKRGGKETKLGLIYNVDIGIITSTPYEDCYGFPPAEIKMEFRVIKPARYSELNLIG